MIPFTCPCCEVLQPPHRDGCTYHADCPISADDFDEMSVLRAEIARLREERRAVQVVGDIIDMEYSGELGVYYGTIRCPTCDQDVSVWPMADRPKCRCGIEWDFSVSAVGEQPPPTGPEWNA